MLKATAVRSPWFVHVCLKSGSQLACQAPGALPEKDTIHRGGGKLWGTKLWGGDKTTGRQTGDIWPGLAIPHYHKVLVPKGLRTMDQ